MNISPIGDVPYFALRSLSGDYLHACYLDLTLLQTDDPYRHNAASDDLR